MGIFDFFKKSKPTGRPDPAAAMALGDELEALPLRSAAVIFLIALSLSVFGQLNDGRIRQLVLKYNNSDSTFKFHNRKDSTDTYLRYPGFVRSRGARTFKIMTSCWRWGIANHRATNLILIFDGNDIYLGGYYVTTTDDLPDKIEGDKLIFLNRSDSNCDPGISTALSFANGIPKQFFRKCKGKYGDIYSFGIE